MKDGMKLSLSPKLLEKLVWQGLCILVEGIDTIITSSGWFHSH
jgi:hypothetical protein